MSEHASCAVLVTGGNGFLGQHVVGLLQTRADHVTEIRVLDVMPYENKLEYDSPKPLKSIVGSVTDEGIVQEACRGVDSVIHIAGIPDSRMFPDKNRINEVNVKGTILVLSTALRTAGVKRFIYCSSMSVAIGDGDVNGLITETDPIPKRRLFEPYASSKLAGEQIVLAANSASFRAVVLRPLVMWGELDTIYVRLSQTMASRTFGYLPTINSNVQQHNSYVGNTAWGFVCAEKSIYNEQRTNNSIPNFVDTKREELCGELRRRSGNKPDDIASCFSQAACMTNTASGTDIYYIADDTPTMEPFAFQRPFLEGSGYRLTTFKIPVFFMAVLLRAMYIVLGFIRLFGFHVNFPVGEECMAYYKRSFVFSDDKAREELGYTPLYTSETSKERAMRYYKIFSYK